MSSIKACFKSRYPEGYLMEVDFSQLEVVALAILSGDTVLKNDILSGRDMHRMRAAELFGVPEADVTDAQRQVCKQLSFQLQYGAGYKSMAEKNGCSETVAKNFIENYYTRYPLVEYWQKMIAEEVKSSRRPGSGSTSKGFPRGEGVHMSPTGRMYKFYEYDSSYGRHGTTSFSPTEMKNYPVQGFATGDIMALYRGRVYRRLLSDGLYERLLMVNTVHDSLMLDVPTKEDVYLAYEVCREEAERLPDFIEELWGIEVDVPLKVECKYGPRWSDMTKL
jgi:DNA polymerase-1